MAHPPRSCSFGSALVLSMALAAGCTLDFDAPFDQSPGQGRSDGGQDGPVTDQSSSGGFAGKEAGAGGLAGHAATAGAGGAAGQGGTAGAVSEGGAAGGGGVAGQGGSGGAAGSGGSSGTGGKGGASGKGGSSGTAGSGASAGTGGAGGSGGCSPVGHDEDKDQVDDACDNCPVASNAQQDNTDGDGIGNACEDFNASLLGGIASFSSWAAGTSGWTLDNHGHAEADRVRLTYTPCSAGCLSIAVQDQAVTGVSAVEAVFRMSVADGAAGVAMGFDPTTGEFLSCELLIDDNVVWLQLWFESLKSLAACDMIKEDDVGLTVSEVLNNDQRLRLTWDGAALKCELWSAGGLIETVSVAANVIGSAPSGRAGVMIWGSDVAFNSFARYEQ